MENDVKILIFNINDASFATDIMQVERILGYSEPTVIPDSPDFVKGVINYEGRILPIINLANKFHLSDNKITEATKIIVTKHEEGSIGIIVDLVSEVMDVQNVNIDVPPDIVSGISKRYIKGLIRKDDKIIILLDMDTVFTEDDKIFI